MVFPSILQFELGLSGLTITQSHSTYGAGGGGGGGQ